jgi:hypothetical protein
MGFRPLPGDRVTADMIQELQSAAGPSPALVEWSDDLLTVEPDASAARARGAKLIASQAFTMADGRVPRDPIRVAFELNGRLAGREESWKLGSDGKFRQAQD